MAYSNWGAFVYKNGDRQKAHEDSEPYRETETITKQWEALLKSNDQLGGKMAYHASLGDMDVRLCGYKCYPYLFDKGKQIDIKPFYKGVLDAYGNEKFLPDDYDMRFEYEGYKIMISKINNFIDLKLTQPDGSIWNSRCGYCYGAGHDD